MRMKLAGLAALLAFLALYTANFNAKHPGSNPDQWFHLAISRMNAEHGLVRTLPQVDDLGWSAGFPEKEFLFHAVTTLGQKLGGETGVYWSGHLLSALALAAIYLIAASAAGPGRALALTILITLLNPYFTPRMTFLRPHVLAVSCFTIGTWAILAARRGLAFASFAAFSLAYHAFFLPPIPAAVAIAFFLRTDRKRVHAALCALGGSVAGILANPYFPASYLMGLRHLEIALLHQDVPGMEAGGELAAMSPGAFFMNFTPPLLALAFALLLWRRGPQPAQRRPVAYLITLAGVLWVLAIRSPRACEYAIPMTVLALAFALGRTRVSRHLLVTGAAVLAAGPLHYAASELLTEPDPSMGVLTQSIHEAIAAIPKEPRGAKVFNCDWNTGSFLLYGRPDLKFVDLLDPRFLRFHSPDKYEQLRLIKSGEITDVITPVKRDFKADYVLCMRADLNERFDRGKGLATLYSHKPLKIGAYEYQSPMKLYRVKSD